MSHDSDFYTWTQDQAALMRRGQLAALDIANLIEEIEDIGRSEKRELENRLAVLLAHLLKWQYQPNYRSSSWDGTIREQRFQANKCLRENPGLKAQLTKIFLDAYDTARFQAIKETSLKLDSLPVTHPWTITEVLNKDFWPE